MPNVPNAPHSSQDLPAPGPYVIDTSRSTVAFSTRHFFGLGGVRGTFGLTEGQVHIDPSPTRSSAGAVADSASFSTSSGARDKVVRSSVFLDSAVHPHITFTSGEVRSVNDGYTVAGVLTVKGVSKATELAVGPPERVAGAVRFRATTRIDRYAFGITARKGMTGRYLDLSLDIVVVAASAPSSASASATG